MANSPSLETQNALDAFFIDKLTSQSEKMTKLRVGNRLPNQSPKETSDYCMLFFPLYFFFLPQSNSSVFRIQWECGLMLFYMFKVVSFQL